MRSMDKFHIGSSGVDISISYLYYRYEFLMLRYFRYFSDNCDNYIKSEKKVCLIYSRTSIIQNNWDQRSSGYRIFRLIKQSLISTRKAYPMFYNFFFYCNWFAFTTWGWQWGCTFCLEAQHYWNFYYSTIIVLLCKNIYNATWNRTHRNCKRLFSRTLAGLNLHRFHTKNNSETLNCLLRT